ncbi:MAG: DNA polymerase III subunit delta [Clostridia bacterium]|nr:DNA polymerase III subunit delta [Clostridia bacterium]
MAEVDIKKEYKDPIGVYILFGEEDYLKRFYASKIRASVLGDSPYALFNHAIFTSKDFSDDSLIDALATPPIGEEKKLIELTELNFSELKAAEIEILLDFFEAVKEYDYAVVLLNIANGALDYGNSKGSKITKPSTLYKKLSAVAKCAYLPKASQRDLAVWAAKHFSKDSLSIETPAVYQLIEQCSSDMMTMSGEIDKLCAFMHASGRDTVTKDDIKNVCCETREVEPFGLSNAVLAGKTDAALGILNLMEEKHIRPAIAFAGIYSTYIDLYRVKAALDGGVATTDLGKKLKMNEYRASIYANAARGTTLKKISHVLSLCRANDLKIKSETSSYDRLKALICEAARGNRV